MNRNSIPLLILTICIAALTLSSCDQNTPDDVILLRTDRFTQFKADHVESWVFISDRNGRLLDIKKTSEEEGVVEFEGVADDWITVTEVSVASFEQTNSPARLQHTVTSYVGVPLGSSYFIEESDYDNTGYPDTLGRASLELNNYSESSEPLFSIGFSDGYNSFNNWLDRENTSFNGSTFRADMILRESPMDIFVSAYDGPDPVYMWLRDVEVGNDIIIDFNSFSPLTKVPINKPVTNAYIQGQIEPKLGGRGYELSRSDYRMASDDYEPSETITIGYVDGFEYYDIYAQSGPIYCCQPHENVVYHKLGSAVPESITLPDYEFVLSNGNLFNLNYSFDQSYEQANLYFTKQDADNTFNWFISVPEGIEIVVPRIPSEIMAQYPFLDSKELPLKNVRFTDYLDAYSYQDDLRRYLELKPGRTEFEVYEYFIGF